MTTSSSVRIGVDARFLGTGTGLARYTGELLTAILEENPPECLVIFVREQSDAAHLPLREGDRVIEADFGHYSVAEQTRFGALLRHEKVDLLFAAHFNVPLAAPVPIVMTVHDLILHRHPGDASRLKQAIYRLVVGVGVRRSRAVIAVSQATKNDLIASYGQSLAAKTHVISEGVSPTFAPSDHAELTRVVESVGLRVGSYLLYVGNAKPHKNVPALIQAWQESGSARELILVGAHELGADLPTGVRRIAEVDDTLLAHLYSGAAALATMTLDEGYCLPVAEALACGCPVIASDIPAIAETAQGHALLLEPSVAAFREALAAPPAKGPAVRVGEWATAAASTLALLRQVLDT